MDEGSKYLPDMSCTTHSFNENENSPAEEAYSIGNELLERHGKGLLSPSAIDPGHHVDCEQKETTRNPKGEKRQHDDDMMITTGPGGETGLKLERERGQGVRVNIFQSSI